MPVPTHACRSNVPVTAMERHGHWRTWTYRVGGAVSARFGARDDRARDPAAKTPRRALKRRR